MKTEERTLNEITGKVEIITTRTVDRYTPRIDGRCDFMCEDTVDEIKRECKIYVPRGEYTSLSNFEMDYDALNGTLAEDLETFQNELDSQFGSHKYEAFVLGAYIHSATAFSVNKCGNRVCRWDSSQLGFIGLPVDSNDGEFYYTADKPDEVANELTNAWNGFYNEYQIYDELECEVVDSCVSAETPSEWIESAEKTYHVSFDDVEPMY